MSRDEEHNGYANYATWRVANDRLLDVEDEWRREARYFDSEGELADALEAWVAEYLDDLGGTGWTRELADTFLAGVRWESLAEQFAPTLVRQTCASCGWPQDPPDATTVPALHDDEGWADVADFHEDGCEWVVTRAHRRPVAAYCIGCGLEITGDNRPPEGGYYGPDSGYCARCAYLNE